SVYKVLSAQIEGSGATAQLVLVMRLTNKGVNSLNFWGDSARLIADGIPAAPVEAPDLVVDGDSAQQGEFRFALPQAGHADLQVGQVGRATALIPLDFTKAAR